MPPRRWDTCRDLDEGQNSITTDAPSALFSECLSEEGSRVIPFSGMTFHPVVRASSCAMRERVRTRS